MANDTLPRRATRGAWWWKIAALAAAWLLLRGPAQGAVNIAGEVRRVHELPGSSNQPAFGMLVLHPDDCRSAWRMLDLVARDDVQAHWPVQRILLRADTIDGSWRRTLPENLSRTPAAVAQGAELRTTEVLGVDRAPALLLYRGGWLAGVERMPISAREFVRMGRRLLPNGSG